MNPTAHAARLGLDRGWREFKQTFLSSDQIFNVVIATIFLAVLAFQRGSTVAGTPISLGMATLPSMLGMLVAFGGIMGTASQLSINRTDGTLLRAKAVPQGIIGYVVARVVQVFLDGLPSLLIILIPGLFLIPGLAAAGVTGWLTMLWVLILGLLATMPWGAAIGSLTKTPQSTFGFAMLPIMGITAISGIFYPIYALPGWLQAIAQVFPIYWLGLGMRSALLPEAAVAAEIGESWRTLETIGVLGVWAVIGLILAPPILRRMARRESGSAMEARRQRAMQEWGT